MNAVWSFWSKPYLHSRESSWFHDWHHWLAWGLSLHVASQHYPKTCLVTDDDGARMLADRLGLPFYRVSTALNKLDGQDPEWWALGKIEAYRRQTEPFVHIDTDVFLWKPLPPEVGTADVFAQCPERITRGASCYRPEELERAVGYPEMGWMPRAWRWYGRIESPVAACCGIFGGARIDFIRYYAQLALKLVTDPRNAAGLSRYRGKVGQMILIEQYLLNACLEYHRQKRRSRFADVEIRYIFDTMEKGYSRDAATAAGFTHLAAGAKRHPKVARDLERRVRQDLPEYYTALRRALSG